MPVIDTESIVLKSYDLAEADRIVVFFARHHGVVRGVAKGIKRLTSRYGSAFEPFNSVQLTYFQKEDRELVTIQSAEISSSNFVAASDPDVLSAFSYIADLLLAFAPPNDPNDLVFRMLRACFETRGLDPERLPAVRVYFELWLLKLGGFLPDWSRCHICRREFHSIERPGIDHAEHLVCADCHKGRLADPVPQHLLTVFHNVQKMTPGDFAQCDVDNDAVREVSAVLRRIIESVLDRPLASAADAAIQSR